MFRLIQMDHDYIQKPVKSRNTKYCCVPQCGNNGKSGISFHLFPKDKIMKKKWETALRMVKPGSPTMRVCSRHFRASDYFPNNSRRQKLFSNVIPSRYIPKRRSVKEVPLSLKIKSIIARENRADTDRHRKIVVSKEDLGLAIENEKIGCSTSAFQHNLEETLQIRPKMIDKSVQEHMTKKNRSNANQIEVNLMLALENANFERSRSRRRVSLTHVEELLNYMERYPTFAQASIRYKEGEEVHVGQHLWKQIALDLNKLDDDVKYTGKGWSRFWVDLRFKVRRKYLNYRRCGRVGQPWHNEFTPYQKRIINLLTDDDGNLADEVGGADSTDEVNTTIENGELSNQVVVKVEEDDHTYSNTEQVIQVQTTEVLQQDKVQKDNKSSSDSKSTEELKRELLEFDLRKQKEMFEIEKKHILEKHAIDIDILDLRRKLLQKELESTL